MSATTSTTRSQPAVQVADVPTVRARLVQSVRVLPHQGASVRIQLQPGGRLQASEAVLLEPSTHESPLQVEDSLLQLTGDFAQVTVFNPTGCSSSMEDIPSTHGTFDPNTVDQFIAREFSFFFSNGSLKTHMHRNTQVLTINLASFWHLIRIMCETIYNSKHLDTYMPCYKQPYILV